MGSFKVALVEGSSDDGLLLQEHLEEVAGGTLKMRQAWTLKEAHDLLGSWLPDVVLLDLGSPDSQGLDTLTGLLRAHPELPIVVLTGDSRPELGSEAVRAGAQDFIVQGREKLGTLLRTVLHAVERRRNKENFQAMFEHAPVGMMLLSSDGIILRVNGRFARDTGSDQRDLESRSFEEFVIPQERGNAREWLKSALSLGTSEQELQWTRLDGGIETVHCTATGLPNQDTVLAVLQNVTRQRQVEAGLQQAQKMDALGRLAGGLAHDFNNLLTTIMGYADLLRAAEARSPEDLEGLEVILGASKRAAELTRKLLTFARRQVSQVKPLDVNVVVNELESVMRGILGENKLLEIRCPAEAAWVLADRSNLDQTLLNLILNARDAMPRGGNVRLEVVSETHELPLVSPVIADPLPPGDYVRITVADTGEGMTEEVRRRIFEPFFTTKPPEKGTGLGLATVYGIVQQVRGSILLDTTPGHGTALHIYLPRVTSPRMLRSEPPQYAPVEGATILLIEDDPAIRTVVGSLLERRSNRVLLAPDGAAGLQLARQHPIDVVISDVVMPGLSGAEVVASLRELLPTSKLLLTSGYAPDAALRNQIQAGEIASLPKPFSVRDLELKLSQLLTAG